METLVYVYSLSQTDANTYKETLNIDIHTKRTRDQAKDERQ